MCWCWTRADTLQSPTLFRDRHGNQPRDRICSVCDEIAELGEQKNQKALSISGYGAETWILADFVTVIVHAIHSDGPAAFSYDLENLWGDAPKLEWKK